MTIYFDMDGTIADLYSVENWLEKLRSEDASPYEDARPLCNLQALARRLNRLQRAGYRLGIISWCSKEATPQYDDAVRIAKANWLHKHLTSVHWDEVNIVSYGVPKSSVACEVGILFDDEERNRIEWGENAFDATEIFSVLGTL